MTHLHGSFTGGGTAPQVASAQAMSPNTVKVTFNEAMTENADYVLPANYVITHTMGSNDRTVTDVEALSTTEVLLTLDGSMTTGTANYTVTVSNVIDLVANVIDAGADSADFDGIGGFTGTGITIGRDGGGPLDIVVNGVPPGVYTTYVGPLGTIEDPLCYVGEPDTGAPNDLTFEDIGGGDVQATGAYLPPNPVGGPYSFTLVAVPSGSTYNVSLVTVIARSFRNRTILLRRMMPPWYKTGIRDPSIERFPQT